MLYYYANLSLRYFYFSLSQALWWGAVSMAHQVRGSSWAVDSLIQMLMLDKKSEMLSKSNNSSKIRPSLCFIATLLLHIHYLWTLKRARVLWDTGIWQTLNAKNAVLLLLTRFITMDSDAAFSCLWGCMLSVNNSSVALLLPHCKEMLPCLICAHVIRGLCVFSLALWTARY